MKKEAKVLLNKGIVINTSFQVFGVITYDLY